ncbi:RNA polymerase sigma-70 factor [Nonomuraea sp. NPDC050790]|uniref:RNA polymerase sigma-70 factor n=1 Tax=Nonomuraea sp. NPDC050790 TaxID=3364371 RepID=UPI003799C5DE
MVLHTDSDELEDLDEAAAVFDRLRSRLFGIAYRMLASVTEAEDLVQDVWLRWQTYDRARVEHPAGFLATITTRLALNAATSARARRETYLGPWLPEPVDTTADPYLGAERGEAMEFAVLMLLERLSPPERAAYVLREAFDYPYREIAEIVEVSEPAARQLVSRARKHLRAGRRATVTDDERRRLLTAFMAAARSGDLEALEKLLAADVISYADGGGAVRAARFPVEGAVRVAKYVKAFSGHFWVGLEVVWAQTNGQTSAVLMRDGQVYTVLTVDAAPDGIDRILWIMNPAKFGGVTTGSEEGGSATGFADGGAATGA